MGSGWRRDDGERLSGVKAFNSGDNRFLASVFSGDEATGGAAGKEQAPSKGKLLLAPLLRATGEAPRAVASTALATLSTLSPPRSCLWTDLSR